MDIPKYLKTVLDEGRLRIFENSSISDMKDFEKYTFCLFPDESWVRGEKAINDTKTMTLAEKIVAFVRRSGGGSEIGEWDYCYFLPCPTRDSQREYANKVYFLKIGITDPVAFEIEKLYGASHLLESKGYSGNAKRFIYDKSNPKELVSDKGWFLERSCLNYEYEDISSFTHCDNDDLLILYSRSYHNKYSWYSSWFDGKGKDIVSDEDRNKIGEEAGLITSDLYKLFPNGVVDISNTIFSKQCYSLNEDEGNLFYHGKYADYWARIIARQGDYNIYVKAFPIMH